MKVERKDIFDFVLILEPKEFDEIKALAELQNMSIEETVLQIYVDGLDYMNNT